ncbi:MAG: FtsX-like permease family protein [Bacteroidales bacterium]|jgi:ABC-type lipoprotein release transport system permease subunit|nr:FtsX-like permease family protein [Bacteroidales bacterium]
MKIAFKLAFKNLIGAGLRTWLNVAVLSFCFIVIVFYNGFLNGWQNQGRQDAMEWEYGHGQLLHADYNPYDVFTINDGHGSLSAEKTENLSAVLVRQASVYPKGRMNPVLLKGISADQDVIKLPIELLAQSDAEFPVLIGTRMAETLKMKEGDHVLLRWRDKNGTYDAANITIAAVFESKVATIDNGQIWMSLDKLREMTGLTNEASYFIANEAYQPTQISGWEFQGLSTLLKDFDAAVQAERIASVIIYSVLLALGLLAVFDTQVLSIFRRQKEIGTYIALGMTRLQVLKIFTVEGSMYSIFGGIAGLLLGAPLFYFTATQGINAGSSIEGMGVQFADIIYPVFGSALIAGTFVLLVFSATLVSFLPARKITKLNPVYALKGKIS